MNLFSSDLTICDNSMALYMKSPVQAKLIGRCLSFTLFPKETEYLSHNNGVGNHHHS